MGALFVVGIDGVRRVDHPLQVIGQVLVVEAAIDQHLDDVVVRARRLDIFPAPIAAQEAFVQLVERVPIAQPGLVLREGVVAVARVATALRAPGGGVVDAVPEPPDQQARPVLISIDDMPQQAAAVFAPGRMVVTVDHAALRICPTGVRRHRLPQIVNHPHVGMLASQPLGACAVGAEHDVQPDIEPVLLPQVEHHVEVVQLVLPGPGLHVIPIGVAAHDAHAGGPDARIVAVPHVELRDWPAVVFRADGKRVVGNADERWLRHAASHPAGTGGTAACYSSRLGGASAGQYLKRSSRGWERSNLPRRTHPLTCEFAKGYRRHPNRQRAGWAAA